MPSDVSEPEEVLHDLPHAPLVFPRTFLHHRPSLGPQQVFAGVVVVKRPDGGGGFAGEFPCETHGRDAARRRKRRLRRSLNRAGGKRYREDGIRALVDGTGHEVRDRERLIGEREFPRRFIDFRPGTGLCNRCFFTAPGDEVTHRPRVEAFVGAAQKPYVAVGFDGGVISNKSPFILTHELFNR